MDELVHGHQLHGGDAKVREVCDRGRMSETGVGATQVVGNVGMAGGEPFDVELVDDGLVPRPPQLVVVAPFEPWVRDDGSWYERGAVARLDREVVAAERVAVHGWSQYTPPSIALAYGSRRSFAGLHRRPASGRRARRPGTRSAAPARRRT